MGPGLLVRRNRELSVALSQIVPAQSSQVASVTAKEVATQTVSATTSNQDGYYTLPYLKPGTYNLRLRLRVLRPRQSSESI